MLAKPEIKACGQLGGLLQMQRGAWYVHNCINDNTKLLGCKGAVHYYQVLRWCIGRDLDDKRPQMLLWVHTVRALQAAECQ